MLNYDEKYNLKEFKKIIYKKYPEDKINILLLNDENLKRILIAKDFKLDEAFTMFENVYKWRNLELFHKIENIKTETIIEVKKKFPSYWLSTDKLGNPVYIECPGAYPITNILKITTIDELISIYIKNCEYMLTHLYPKLKTKNQLIQTVTIIDLKGISIRNMNNGFYTYLKNIICIGSNYYPETIYKMFIINTPFMFSTVWKVIRSFVPQKTQNKVHILSKGQETLLYKYIDKDKLPDNLDFSNITEIYPLEKEYIDWLNS
jgi:hypothetical protein